MSPSRSQPLCLTALRMTEIDRHEVRLRYAVDGGKTWQEKLKAALEEAHKEEKPQTLLSIAQDFHAAEINLYVSIIAKSGNLAHIWSLLFELSEIAKAFYALNNKKPESAFISPLPDFVNAYMSVSARRVHALILRLGIPKTNDPKDRYPLSGPKARLKIPEAFSLSKKGKNMLLLAARDRQELTVKIQSNDLGIPKEAAAKILMKQRHPDNFSDPNSVEQGNKQSSIRHAESRLKRANQILSPFYEPNSSSAPEKKKVTKSRK